MKKLIMTVMTVALAFAGRADLMTYAPQGGENLWSDTSAWRIDGAAVGRVPTEADDVSLFGAWTAAFPLTVSTGSAATANTIGFGNAISGSAGDVVHMKIEGTLTTASTFATNVWGTAGVTSVVTVAEGGSFTGSGCDWIGATARSCTIITNRGAMTFNNLHLVNVKNAEASIDNYGDLTVNGECIIGARANKGPTGLGRLHLHPGSTFTKKVGKTASGNWTYFDVGSGVPGEVIVENCIEIPGGDQILLGRETNVEGHFVIQGDGMVTNASGGTLSMSIGDAAGSIGRLTMKDNARLAIKHSTCCLSGAEKDGAKAYVTMSGNAFIDAKNSGFSFGAGAKTYTEFNMSGNTLLSSPAAFPIATGEGATARVVLTENSGLYAKTHLQFGGKDTTVELCVSNNAYLSATRQHMFLSEPDCTGTGTVTMVGGQIQIYPRKNNEYIPFLFGSDGVVATLRGYGAFSVMPGQSQSATKRCGLLLRGKMIASGFGTPQDLDATTLTMSNAVDEVNANGNSGWYAENGGRLCYPHTIAVPASGEVTIGDNNDRTVPELVNSFHVKLTELSANYYLFANLYASDRTEIPSFPALGAKDVALGFWNMGYASGSQFAKDTTTAKSFQTAEVTIRHATDFVPARKLKNYEIVAYHCHEDGDWTEVARKPFDLTNPRITLEGLKRDTSGTCYNIGWIVLVAECHDPGLMLLLK